jgi:hypothetical protein
MWQMISSKDLNFVGYTYKNFEIVSDYQVPGMGMFHFSLSSCILFYVICSPQGSILAMVIAIAIILI